MSRFQLIFTASLVALGIAGAVIFAISKNSASKGAVPVVMWGTISQEAMTPFISKVDQDNTGVLSVSYVQKDASTFESNLVSALADGTGPDMVLLPQDLILKQLNKFYTIPFTSYSERAFKDSFIQEGELYLSSTGIIALPFSIDPMVMYWNRDMFSNAGVALPPTTWSQFFDLAPKLTTKDSNGNILQSAIAFGESRNIEHFKDILALLALQAGTPIVATDSTGNLTSQFGSSGAQGLVPGEEAASYFTEFSNPLKTSYSWNASLPLDVQAFAGNQLAVYFGYASELSGLRAANPNLNFDVAMVPQTEGRRLTFGNMTGIALLKSSKNIVAAYGAAVALTSPTVDSEWIAISGLPPVHRALLATLPGDAYSSIFYQSALISDAWLDPNRESTIAVFSDLVNNVISGKLLVSAAVTQASQQIGALLTADAQAQ